MFLLWPIIVLTFLSKFYFYDLTICIMFWAWHSVKSIHQFTENIHILDNNILFIKDAS